MLVFPKKAVFCQMVFLFILMRATDVTPPFLFFTKKQIIAF